MGNPMAQGNDAEDAREFLRKSWRSGPDFEPVPGDDGVAGDRGPAPGTKRILSAVPPAGRHRRGGPWRHCG